MRLADCPRPTDDTGISAHLGNETIGLGDIDLAWRMGARWFIYLHNSDDGSKHTRYIVPKGGMPVLRLYALFPRGPEGTTLADMLRNYRAAGGYYVKLWNETNNNYECDDGTPDATKYAQVLMGAIEETLAAGCIPVVGNLSPGGNWPDYHYWCTVLDYWKLNGFDPFNRDGLATVVGVHNYCDNKPLDWGAGGPAAWPPNSAQDNIGFRNWEWYQAAVQERFGLTVPVMCTEGGPRLGDWGLHDKPRTGPAEHRQFTLDIADFIQNGHAPDYLLNVTGFWTFGWQSNFDADNYFGGPLEASKQALESYPWHVRPTGTVPTPTPEPIPIPEPEPVPVPAPIPPTATRWSLVSVRRLSAADNHLMHNIFFTPADLPMLISWPDDSVVMTKDFPMQRGVYTVQVADADSDVATIPGTDIWENEFYEVVHEDGTVEQVLGNSNGHWSYAVEFRQEEAMPDVDYPGATWQASPNMDTGRAGNPIGLIVCHWTAGSESAAINHLTSPASGASAHYILGRAGAWTQLVREADTAWHAGDLSVNRRSIGVEVVADASNPVTEAQYNALALFVATKAREYGFGVSADTIKRHSDIVPTQCPGALDIERVIEEAGGSVEPLDWNGADWWLAMSERDRWLRFVEVNGANAEYKDNIVPGLEQKVRTLESQLRACESLGRQVMVAASLNGG